MTEETKPAPIGGDCTQIAQAKRFKYRCDDDCRSPRCEAALERIAAGWRNGRDIAPGVRGPEAS
jgi:hypothetical protein